MATVRSEYIAIGGNRHPAAADWDPGGSGILAFGANNHVALWKPKDPSTRGVTALLVGHTDVVNVVKFFFCSAADQPAILSASADRTIRIWLPDRSFSTDFKSGGIIARHENSINCVDILPESDIFISGSADASVKVWKLDSQRRPEYSAELIQSISVAPKMFPLALSVARHKISAVFLAIAGTRAVIKIFAQTSGLFTEVATLTGHEGWIRALDFVQEPASEGSDLILASASQDKYIRLWRIHNESAIDDNQTSKTKSVKEEELILTDLSKSLSNKALRFDTDVGKYSVTFEALLLGHDDWIFSATWFTAGDDLRLLTASADNSLAVWKPEASSGIWICVARLGEISALRGATTATGTTGGFWIGLWSPCGNAVVSLGRTGNWRLWHFDPNEGAWSQGVATGGHVKEVKDITWADDGSYLLSTSSDQTTRMHAEWKRGDLRTWHEMSRPQIHGYDLNCIASIGNSTFISGADEKLLRVFDKPRIVANMLQQLSGIGQSPSNLPDAANIPVLGLSNKAQISVEAEETTEDTEADLIENGNVLSIARNANIDTSRPPIEDYLARHTLWPEKEKLYGHGYEISAVTTSHDRTVVATACRASAIDHAVIRLYETQNWREVKPPLSAHSLTVTSLQFSGDDQYLLSVSRDRQWVIFLRQSETPNGYRLLTANAKGHARMILDASWAPHEVGRVFATAGRDKCVKLWRLVDDNAMCFATLPAPYAVTAVSFLQSTLNKAATLAFGTEDGLISISTMDGESLTSIKSFCIDRRITPTKSINAIAWRPLASREPSEVEVAKESMNWLAVASDDSSLRVYLVPSIRHSDDAG